MMDEGSGAHGHDEQTCEEIFAALSDYIDGELDESICERLESHMSCCEPCREFLESLRRTVSWLSEQPPPELSSDAREQICAAFRRRCGEISRSPSDEDNSNSGDPD